MGLAKVIAQRCLEQRRTMYRKEQTLMGVPPPPKPPKVYPPTPGLDAPLTLGPDAGRTR